MRKIILILSIFLIASQSKALTERLAIIPYPQQLEHLNGSFKIDRGKHRLQLATSNSSGLDIALTQLRNMFGDSNTAGKKKILLGIPSENPDFDKTCRSLKLWPNAEIGDEGYVLQIKKDTIVLAANTRQGLFYGVQTLRQIAREKGRKLPCVKIADWPIIRYRGMQDDISRGPVPTMDYLKMQIRRCSELKLNFLTYYIEHIVKTESQPYFAPAGGSISIADWKELSDYAAKYHVELVGSFQSFGHFEKILSFPQYEHLGESGRLLSPAFDESYDFLKSIYSEMAPAFSSHFFNVNCDETFDLGRGASKPLVDSLGLGEVYLRHMQRLHKIVSGLDKRMMMWGDVANQHPEIFSKLPKETIIMGWDYSPRESFDDIIDPILENGFDFFVVPGILNSNRLMPDYFMAKGNIKNFLEGCTPHNPLGVLTTVWDDGGFALFSRDWLGVAYAAEKSWNVNSTLDADFDPRFDRVVYGDETNNISTAIMKLSEMTELAPTQNLNEGIFWQQTIPERGDKLTLNLNDWDRVRAICDSAEQMLNAAIPKFYKNELDVWHFTISQYGHMAEERNKILQAANRYKEASMLQLKNREVAREKIVAALDAIDAIQTSYNRLYNSYQDLWLRENRTYWLDRNLEKYQKRMADIAQIKELLTTTIDDLDKGQILPPPSALRLDVKETKGNYFQYWLMVGPFPNPSGKGYDVDHLKALGGETKAIGKVAGEFEGLDGKTHRWQKYQSPRTSEIDLKTVYEKNNEVLVYAYARLTSHKAQTVRATFGSNDGIKVFCNGEMVFERHKKRNLMPDEEEVTLNLKEGRNHILLKIDQNKGGWGFSFRLPDNVLRSHKYKYEIIE